MGRAISGVRVGEVGTVHKLGNGIDWVAPAICEDGRSDDMALKGVDENIKYYLR